MGDKTLVLGASLNPDRYSNRAIKQLVYNNIETVAVGLREGNVNGVAIATQALPFEGVDTVTLYLNAKRQQAYYDYIIDLMPKRVIFNPGTENLELETLLAREGINYEYACTLVLLGTGQY